VWITVWYAGWNSFHPAHSCLKHVEKRNKHTKKNCAPSELYLQYYARRHGQQNIKNYGGVDGAAAHVTQETHWQTVV